MFINWSRHKTTSKETSDSGIIGTVENDGNYVAIYVLSACLHTNDLCRPLKISE